MEQQADIIADYFIANVRNKSVAKKDFDRVLEKFIRNPKDTDLKPSTTNLALD